MDEVISVIVPAYNTEAYIGACLDSILAQTCKFIEIVLVDDGSSDQTGAIADAYKEKYPDRIQVIHTNNQGVTAARFKGVQAAKGTWIGFVDSDDEVDPDMYERLLKNAQTYEADISHCGYRTIVNGGERIHEFYNTGKLAVQNKSEGLKDLLEGGFEPSLCNKLFKKELLLAVLEKDVVDTRIKYNEDLLINYYLFEQAQKSVYHDFCGYQYMARDVSASRGKFRSEKLLDPVKVRKIILEEASDEFKDIAWHKYLTSCMGAYAGLSGKKSFAEEATILKGILLGCKDKWPSLSRNELMKLRLLMVSPALYHAAYGLYSKHFQRKVYE